MQNVTVPAFDRWFFPNRGVEPRATAKLLLSLLRGRKEGAHERRICYRYTSSEGVFLMINILYSDRMHSSTLFARKGKERKLGEGVWFALAHVDAWH